MIQPNASPNEKLSPFFEVNESFCLEFEKFIEQNGGISMGKYNAWSYLIYGKITEPDQWVLEYKKSTFSSGNIFFSAKSQNLFVSAIWKSKGSKDFDFIIRRRKFKDSILSLFNKKINKFETFKDYVLIIKTKPSSILKLASILRPILLSKEVYQISNKNNKLKIELRTDKHYFDIFNQLTDFKLEN